MILGMEPFLLAHVAISLVAILSGIIVLFGLIANERLNGMTSVFLAFTLATSLTGFGFPIRVLTPALTLGVISVVVLTPTLLARYVFAMRGHWRWIFVAGAVASLYFNFFVLVVQAFLKVPALHVLAPNGSEPPFAVAQAAVLLFFFATGYLALRRFHPDQSRGASAISA